MMGSELMNSKRLEFEEYIPAPVVTADNFEGLVRDELGKIGEGFLRIGYYLCKARDNRLYVPLGYDSLYEMSEDLFDLKESSVFNMISVWTHFHSVKNPLGLREDCKGLKYSQLIECLRDKWDPKCCVTRVISSSDTVKETKAKVTAWNVLTGKMSRYPSLEQVEDEVERQKMRKEREEAEAENSKRLESAPELNGQLPGQTSLFVEGYAEEPQEEKLQTFGVFEQVQDENPFEGLPAETEIYADMLVKDMKAQAVEVAPDEVFPSENQMRIHKRQAVSYIDVIERSENIEGVDHFFDMAIKRLVAMRACKLQALKGAKK